MEGRQDPKTEVSAMMRYSCQGKELIDMGAFAIHKSVIPAGFALWVAIAQTLSAQQCATVSMEVLKVEFRTSIRDSSPYLKDILSVALTSEPGVSLVVVTLDVKVPSAPCSLAWGPRSFAALYGKQSATSKDKVFVVAQSSAVGAVGSADPKEVWLLDIPSATGLDSMTVEISKPDRVKWLTAFILPEGVTGFDLEYRPKAGKSLGIGRVSTPMSKPR